VQPLHHALPHSHARFELANFFKLAVPIYTIENRSKEMIDDA
jgi:hypothetical protein